MTKRKAIEAATKLRSLRGMNIASVADRAYDEGFSAGILHAAKRPMATDGGWRPCIGEVQREARALAKKARMTR